MFHKNKRGFAILPIITLAAILIFGGLGIYNHDISPSQNLGAFNPTAGGTYRLGNSISSTDTSIKLSSFTEPISLTKYTMAMLNTDIAYGTIAPQSSQSELISFSGITQNADGSATLTGVVRGLSRSYPYTASSTFRMAHAGQSIFILSDAPGLFNEYVTKRNDETISGAKTFTATSTFASTTIVSTTPTTNTMAANKLYVDTVGSNVITALKAATNIWTGTNTFGTTTFTLSPTVPALPVANTDAASKEYVDNVVVSGVPIANETTTGAGRKATSAQIAAGFASTTPYFIPSSLASSTASTTASIVVVTKSDGTIDGSFLNDSIQVSLTAGENLTAGDAVMVASGNTTYAIDYTVDPNANVEQVVGLTNWAGQTFTGTGRKIRYIRVNGDNSAFTNSNNIVFEIRATSGGLPTGAALATGSLLVSGQNAIWQFSDFQTTLGTVYAYIFYYTVSGSDSNFWNANSNPYGGGTIVTSADSGANWSAVAGSDIGGEIFEVYFEASKVYKTSALSLEYYPTATAELADNFIGFARSNITAGQSGYIGLAGLATVRGTITPGTTVYLSNTYGELASSAGSTNRKVGIALTSSTIKIKQDDY
jgi:hypothetical protein